jgi:hypothetical protein
MWTALYGSKYGPAMRSFYAVLNLPVPQNGNFLVGLVIVTLSRGILLLRLF